MRLLFGIIPNNKIYSLKDTTWRLVYLCYIKVELRKKF